jgi:hypothetical protein
MIIMLFPSDKNMKLIYGKMISLLNLSWQMILRNFRI